MLSDPGVLFSIVAILLLAGIGYRYSNRIDKHKKFCARCLAATEPIAGGSTSRINGIGTRISVKGAQCPECGSQEAQIAFTVFWAPLATWGRYRVLFVGARHYLIRSVKGS